MDDNIMTIRVILSQEKPSEDKDKQITELKKELSEKTQEQLQERIKMNEIYVKLKQLENLALKYGASKLEIRRIKKEK